MSDSWPMVVSVWLGLMALIHAPALVAALKEKRMTWPFQPLDNPPAPEPVRSGLEANPYLAPATAGTGSYDPSTDDRSRANREAAALGYLPLARLRHGKGGTYRVSYDFWISEGREILALVGGGSMRSIPTRSTRLYTRLADGRFLVTSDGTLGSEPDLAKITIHGLFLGVPFRGLVEIHRARLRDAGQPADPFSHSDSMGEFRAFHRSRSDRLAELGLARYLDPDREWWRHTTRGALLVTARAYATGYRRKFFPDRVPKTEGRPARPSTHQQT